MPRLDKVVGSMIVIVSKCSNGHMKTWTSQKCDGRLPWGNMLCAAEIFVHVTEDLLQNPEGLSCPCGKQMLGK